MWDRIATFTGTGPEHLLLMFEKYGKTLIQNQEDTFTEPFEIASKNMSNYYDFCIFQTMFLMYFHFW